MYLMCNTKLKSMNEWMTVSPLISSETHETQSFLEKNFMQFGVNRHFPSCTILPLWNWDWCKAFNININFAFFFQIWLHHMRKVIVMKARVFKLTMDLLFSYWYIVIFVYLCSKLIFCFLVSTTLISDRINNLFSNCV